MNRFVIDTRSESWEGYYYEPNKDYGGTEWCPPGSTTYFFVVDKKTGMRTQKEFHTRRAAQAYINFHLNKKKRK